MYSFDLRIRVLDTGLETYPDVSVVCGSAERHPADDMAVINVPVHRAAGKSEGGRVLSRAA